MLSSCLTHGAAQPPTTDASFQENDCPADRPLAAAARKPLSINHIDTNGSHSLMSQESSRLADSTSPYSVITLVSFVLTKSKPRRQVYEQTSSYCPKSPVLRTLSCREAYICLCPVTCMASPSDMMMNHIRILLTATSHDELQQTPRARGDDGGNPKRSEIKV